MKKILRSLRDRLHFTKSAKVQKSLATALVVFLILGLGGASVSSWCKHIEKHKNSTLPIATKIDKAPEKIANKGIHKTTTPKEGVIDSNDATSTNQKSVQVVKSSSTSNQQIKKRRVADSTNPEWMACWDKVNVMYTKDYNERATLVAEKEAALAEVDRMYRAGELSYDENGNYLDPGMQYAVWYYTKAEIEEEYKNRLMSLNPNHSRDMHAQMAMCESTYDH